MKNNKFLALFIGLALALTSNLAYSEPWIDTSDVFLRTDIQYLADAGLLNVPTTTFPMMWKDVEVGMKQIDPSLLDESNQASYWSIQAALTRNENNHQSIEVNVASDENRFSSFGDPYRDGNFIQGHFSYQGNHWAAKLAPGIYDDERRNDSLRLDDSYLAGFIGNWVISFGMQDRWYGPGWDTSLALTSNARPIPALSLSRASSEPFVMPFVDDWSIPWTVTTYMGQFERERHIPDALLWGFRFNFKLTQALELGLSRTAQWGGEGRPQDASIFWDVLRGHDNCGGEGPSQEECRQGKEPGNQLGGYDIRYNLHPTFSVPISLYMQMNAEDGDRKGGLSIFGEERYLWGIDAYANVFSTPILLYGEYADTFADNNDGVNVNYGSGVGIGDFYYEHKIYKTGLRYQGRVIASPYEGDAKSFVLGVNTLKDVLSGRWQIKLRLLQLNYDNSDGFPDDDYRGNTVSKVAEDVVGVNIKYQRTMHRLKLQTGIDFSHSSFLDSIKSQSNLEAFVNIVYQL
ncbi:capsule assembly Wzi family protein [Thalassotalea litorea]|uniref:capsule assembly Wzi family protein n=1 Tax=Thalassotalea litorea TaxID=2020715 RepID=UPI003735C73C